MDEKVFAAAPHSWFDTFGTTVSIACAIQCSIFPLLVGVLPLIGLGFLLSDGIERFFLATSAVLAIGGFTWGYRYHRRFYVFLFLVSAAALVIAGRLWVSDRYEIPLVVSGALVLAVGHFLNRRLCRLCATCAAHAPASAS